MILAIDPGKKKCGLAILDPDAAVLSKTVVSRREIASYVIGCFAQYRISSVVVGKSSSGKEIEKELSRLDFKTNLVFISEKFSSLEARKRYWQENKPKGILRLIPASMRMLPVPIDDYAAVILGERYLKG